ncbi:LLM class flavin-dependent oxidoreductase [Pseudoalteromonas ruthenica]|uniref:Luciferase-like monooxygenase n=1 Tax=Pseudoalteromonas ruthenica TaxID=151081 RepID=A0A5S3Z3R8_9GAMM|nr:LLM class flavin-dependent oxidoreductase [Pseudoalteromonas ruthenica]TMP86914.1 LLM class flavin-dependent oxidoreductase [Pseudoalteromonas ruthenica]
MTAIAKLSVLDLAPVVQGSNANEAFARAKELAQHVERLGYHRFWMAEHHNMPDIASAATSTVLAYIGAHTQRIRIGSGGVMLPNHAPMIVAEQYGTLAALFPERVDLGIGRAPGSDGVTTRALRRDAKAAEDLLPQLEELQYFLGEEQPGQRVRAYPGVGSHVPLWLLGSSTYSALLAAQKGLPFAFAAHFAPDFMMRAIELYREQFQPSAQLSAPYVMVAVNAIAAATDEQAEFLATTGQQKFVSMIRGQEGLIPPPTDNMDATWTDLERQQVTRMLRESIIGNKEKVQAGLRGLQARTGADEIMLHNIIYDQQARLNSYELIMHG